MTYLQISKTKWKIIYTLRQIGFPIKLFCTKICNNCGKIFSGFRAKISIYFRIDAQKLFLFKKVTNILTVLWNDNEIIGHEKNTADMVVVFYWNYNSYHTIQIFKSFIYLSNLSLNRYCFFRIHAQNHAKIMTVIMYSFVISWQKKIFRMNFVQTRSQKLKVKKIFRNCRIFYTISNNLCFALLIQLL